MDLKDILMNILKNAPDTTKDDLKDIAEASGISEDDFINTSLELLGSLAAGGNSGKVDNVDVDPKELEKGLKIEEEHSPESVIQTKITKDHLIEDDKYNTHLLEMEEKYSTINKVFLNSHTAVVKIPVSQYTGESVQIHKLAEYAGQYGNVDSYRVDIKNNIAHVIFKLAQEA